MPSTRAPYDKLRTGIAGFDDLTCGGLPRGRAVVVSGSPGSGKTVFGLEFLHRGFEAGEAGVFVTFEERREDLTREALGLGWDMAPSEKAGRMRFVDASSISEHQVEAGEYDFGGLVARIRYAVESIGAKRVVIDSIASLFLRYKDTTLIRRELYRITDVLRRLNATTLITAERVRDEDVISRFGVEDFVADGVVRLYHTLAEGERERYMEVVKLRGTKHQTGKHPFLIGDQGISVFPAATLGPVEESPTKRLSIGVPGIDAMSDGGLYAASTTLLMGSSGTGRTVLGLHFLAQGMRKNERGIFFSFEESPAQIMTDASSLGWNFRAAVKAKKLKISAYQPMTMPPEYFLQRMMEKVIEFRPKRVVIDSLTPLASAMPEYRFRRFIMTLNTFLKRQGVTTILNFTSGSSSPFAAESDLATAADNIIVMRFAPHGQDIGREILIVKSRASAHDSQVKRYAITRRGLCLMDDAGCPNPRADKRASRS